MPDLAELNLAINSSQAVQANTVLDRLAGTAAKTEHAAHGLTRGFTTQGGVLGSLMGGYQKLVGLLSLVVGGFGAVHVATRAFTEAAEIEKVTFQFEMLFKSVEAATLMVGKLEEVVEGTSYKAEQVAPAAQALMRVGYSANEALKMLGPIMDMASGKGTGVQGIEQIAGALERMKMRGEASGREMMTLMSAGIDIYAIMAEQTGKATDVVRDEIGKGIISIDQIIDSALMGMSAKYGGAAAKEAETMFGMWAQLQKTIDDVFQAIGQALWKDLNIKEFMKQAMDGLKYIRDHAGDFLRYAIDLVKQLWEYALMIKDAFLVWLSAEAIALLAAMAVRMVSMATSATIAEAAAKGMATAFAMTLAAATLIGDAISKWPSMQGTMGWLEKQFGKGIAAGKFVSGDTAGALNTLIAAENPAGTGPISHKGAPEMIKDAMGSMGNLFPSFTPTYVPQAAPLDEKTKNLLDAHSRQVKAMGEQEKLVKDTNQQLDRQLLLIGETADEQERMEMGWKLTDAGVTATTKGVDQLYKSLNRLQEMKKIREMADEIGNAFGSAFESAIMDAKSFSEVLQSLVKDIERAVLRALIIKPMSEAISGGITSMMGGIMGHADGAIVTAPTYFQSGGRTHVMGENGPEAIVPLNRMGGVTVNQYITTADADSFRRSRGQISNEIKRGLR